MAQQTLGDLLVKLGLDTSSFQTAVAQVTTRVQALQAQFVGMGTATTAAIAPLGSSMEGLSTHLKSTAGAFGAGASFATAISAFGEIGKAAADAEQGQVRLRTAVEATGATWSAFASQLQTAINASKNFGFSQADAAESLSLLVAQTGNTEEAMRRQKLAMDLARGANLDLVTASRLVGKITDENITALNRMGFAVAKNSTEQEALASIQARVAGQAQAQSTTIVAAAQRITNAWLDALGGIGTTMNQFAPGLVALGVAFNALGLRAIFATGGLTAFAEGLRGATTGLLGFGAAAAVALAPIALATAAIGGLLFVAYELGKLGGGNGPLAQFADSVDKLGAIKDKIGITGLLSELTGLGKEATATTADIGSLTGATGVWAKALADVSAALQGVGATGTSAFAEIRKQLTAFLGDMPHASDAIQEIEDKLNGVFGLSAQGRFEKIGADLIASTKAAGDAIVAPLQALYDSAANELAAVARFWADEAQRRMDFTQMMADRAKPVVDTIDQLNKDLGAGFDQRRRAAQAVVKQAQFDAETAKLQQTENRRIANLNPPSTANVDKVNELYGSMAALNLLISQKHADTAASLAATTALITAREADLAEAARIARQEALFATTIPESALAAAAGRGGSLAGPMSDADLSNNRVFGGMPYRIGQSIIDAVTKGIGTMFSATQFQLDLTNSDGSLTGMRPDDVKALFSLIVQGAQTKLNAGQITASGDAVVA